MLYSEVSYTQRSSSGVDRFSSHDVDRAVPSRDVMTDYAVEAHTPYDSSTSQTTCQFDHKSVLYLDSSFTEYCRN